LAGALQVEKIQMAWRRLHDVYDLVVNRLPVNPA
jgi:hypothetical protein